jgi:hypothetical protein
MQQNLSNKIAPGKKNEYILKIIRRNSLEIDQNEMT